MSPCRQGIARRSLLLAGLSLVGWQDLALAAAIPGSPGERLTVLGRVPARPRRVFAAGPPAGALLAALAPEQMLGWPMKLNPAGRPWLPAAVRDKPLLGRLAGRGSTVSLEALLALRPDVIVDAGTVDASYLSTAQKTHAQTGIPYVLVDGRLADTPAQLRQLGRLLGVQARGEMLAAQAERILALAQASSSGLQSRPGVYLARGADGLETATQGSINAEFIEAAGGRNVADTGSGHVARISFEQLLVWQPDWIVTQEAVFLGRLRSDPLWASLPAVRNGRVLLMPDQPMGWIDAPPGVNRLLGVRCLAACLQHGRLPSRLLAEECRRFFALFWGVEPSAQEMLALLEGRT